MIKVGNVVPFIGLNQKWSTAKVETTNNQTIMDRKLITSLGCNFHCNSIDILFSDSDIQEWVKYPMTVFLKSTFYWEKAHDWYLTITDRR